MEIDARGMHYRQLNEMVKTAVDEGEQVFELFNVNGQRYLGSGVEQKIKMQVHGVAGNDLGSFLDGPHITVFGNAQDMIGNTMNDGKVVIHGHAGDVLGYGMRGGSMYIRGNVGYRVGIHMKEYRRQVPVLVAGGTAGDFFGEYMAGGILVLLGLERSPGEPLAGDYLGTGMHGGAIYVRGPVDPDSLGQEVAIYPLTQDDNKLLDNILKDYCTELDLDFEQVRSAEFSKLIAISHRPYGRLYVY